MITIFSILNYCTYLYFINLNSYNFNIYIYIYIYTKQIFIKLLNERAILYKYIIQAS